MSEHRYQGVKVGEDETLTDSEELFVLEYCKSINRARSARLAGYTDGNAYDTGAKLLRKPHIRAAVKREFERRAKELRIDTNFLVLQALDSYNRCVEKGSDSAAAKFLDMLFKHFGLFERDNKQKAGVDPERAKQLLRERGIDIDKLKPPCPEPSEN